MSTKDVIKKSILEGFSMEMSTFHVVLILLITVLLSVYIFYIYRLNSHSSFYSRDFNKTLAIMPVLTAAIVLALQASLVISLGMVGALSIVRFRNAIKNPMDLLSCSGRSVRASSAAPGFICWQSSLVWWSQYCRFCWIS